MNCLLKFFLSFLFIVKANALTVLIDPGHGGDDYGAIGRHHKGHKVYEKDLALRLSKKIQHELKKLNVTTYLTRSVDRTVGLHERSDMAEKIKADLFISVHFNASEKRGSRGIETFYLDNHVDEAIKKVEQIENKGLAGNELIINQILVDLVIEKTAPLSKKLANHIHYYLGNKVIKKYQLKDRGIKPGLFYVLALSKRPAVLLEVGFMSNPKELRLMSSNKFQNRYARAVALGVKRYLGIVKKKQIPLF